MSLNYDKSLACRCLFTVAPDCEIRLTSLHQALTYAGVMVGVPYKSANDGIIEALRKNAGLQYFNGWLPHLLLPPRRDYYKVPGDFADIAETCTQSFKPEFLPAVACVAWFEWPGDFDDEPDEWIHAVMWFQDEFAMPIDSNVLQQLRSLRWYQGAIQIRLHAEQVSEGTLPESCACNRQIPASLRVLSGTASRTISRHSFKALGSSFRDRSMLAPRFVRTT